MNIRRDRKQKFISELIAIPSGLARRFRGFGYGSKTRRHRRGVRNPLSRYLVQALRPAFGAKKQVN